MRRSESSALELRARQFGADYLMSVAGWILKSQPRSLRSARADYRKLCVNLLQRIERTQARQVSGRNSGRFNIRS
jgi:hypothetical protein